MRPSTKGPFVAVLILFCPLLLHGQTQSQDAVWTRLGEPPVQTLDFQPLQGPSVRYSTFGLSQERIGVILRSAPKEFTEQAQNSPTIVTIPFPDGKFERFRVELSPVIEKPLESQGFETITYKGIGIDDPNATIRFEQAFDGFHAMVRSSRGVFYIDPTTKAQKQANQGPYVSYFASARPGPVKRGHCEVSGEQARQKRVPARFSDRIFNELSGGERQRVMIAMALAQEPQILLLDEPTQQLDLGRQAEILDLISELNESRDLTVIAAIHDLNLAARYFNRLVVLHDGSVAKDGSPREVLSAELLQKVYGGPIQVLKAPGESVPIVLPLPAQKRKKEETLGMSAAEKE